MVLVWITVKVRVSVKSLRARVRLKVSVSRVRCCMWMENSASHVYLSVPDGKYHQAFGFGYFIQYYYKQICVLVHRCLNGAAPQYLSELIQPLSDVDSHRRLRSASTAEVLVPAT